VELTDFREARRRIEAKQRHGGDKLTGPEEAVRLVRDGDTLAVGGCLFSRTPLSLVREVLRQGRQGLTLVRNLMCTEGEFLLVAGAAQKIVTSWMSIGLPWGISKILREYAEQGKARFEESSHMGIGLRFRAGAMGLPFLPSLSMLGSDLMGVTGAKTMTCPYTGETLCLVPALFPDVALLHVHRADRTGNCQIDGYPHMDADIAKAATTVLVTAEEIIPEEEIRRRPDRTIVPGFLVDAVVEAPFGSYPHECYGLYEADFDHFTQYVAGIDARGSAAVREYLQKYVYSPKDHADYLDLFGMEVLMRQRRFARELTA
jgi:glutaconate CoA-transferase subunit A